nr:uncharacterized protein LOC101151917 isoform X8 [Gorilla gorilla gorilla]
METNVFQGRLRLHFHPGTERLSTKLERSRGVYPPENHWPGVHHLKIVGLLQVSSLHWKKRSWISRCCCLHLLRPSWSLALQDSQRCCSENPKASVEEQNSSRGSGKMRSPPHVDGHQGWGWRM